MKGPYKTEEKKSISLFAGPLSVIVGLLLVILGLTASFLIVAFDVYFVAATRAIALFASASFVTIGIFFLGLSILNR